MMTYEAFSKAIADALRAVGKPLTWTEVRTAASLPQAFPNNKWVRKMESDIGLKRQRDAHGIINWQLGENADSVAADASAAKTPVAKASRTNRK